jgi:hypothetical protein
MLKNQKLTLLTTGIILILIASCSKSKSSPSTQGPLGGNWNFVSLHVQTQATIQVTQAGETDKNVSVSNYTSIKNAGVFVFTADSMVATGFTYSVADSVTGYDYINGVLQDSARAPFNVSFPVMNNSVAYQLVGTDSLYFPGGGTFAGLAGAQATEASGAKFIISGNTMTISAPINQVSTTVIQGISANKVILGNYTVTLQKQ